MESVEVCRRAVGKDDYDAVACFAFGNGVSVQDAVGHRKAVVCSRRAARFQRIDGLSHVILSCGCAHVLKCRSIYPGSSGSIPIQCASDKYAGIIAVIPISIRISYDGNTVIDIIAGGTDIAVRTRRLCRDGIGECSCCIFQSVKA